MIPFFDLCALPDADNTVSNRLYGADGAALDELPGDQDPVGDFGKGPKHLYKIYKSLGLDCRLRMYKDSRHELLHDLDRQKVCKDLIKWLDYYVEKL